MPPKLRDFGPGRLHRLAILADSARVGSDAPWTPVTKILGATAIRKLHFSNAKPLGLYTTKNPNVPWPSPALDKFLLCLEGCIGAPIVVTSTTNGKHQDPGHAAGTSVDIRPPAGVSSGTVFCCAGKCGAAWGLDEGPGGQSFQNTQGYNFHYQLFPPHHPSPNAPNAIPPNCKPNGCSQK
jgi:hypothetical protein